MLVQALVGQVLPRDGPGVRSGAPAMEEPALTFAGLLRQLRAEARLTQEELAEAAGLSPRSVSDLERGINRTAASYQQALALARSAGDRGDQAWTLIGLGLLQQLTRDYPAAAASHQQALTLFSELGNLLGQAEALNRLGELSLRTAATGQAHEQHTQALAIARDIRAAPEEARALEGIGNSHLREGNPGQAAAHLRQALTIYQRIGAPAARRVQGTVRNADLPENTEAGARQPD